MKKIMDPQDMKKIMDPQDMKKIMDVLDMYGPAARLGVNFVK